MGFADMLLLRGISYNSDEGVEAAREIMSFINRVGHEASEELAKHCLLYTSPISRRYFLWHGLHCPGTCITEKALWKS